MSTFVSLYGDLLDTELGSADRTQLFTLARRKAAINQGQREFARLTGCFVRSVALTLVDEQARYDLEALITAGDFAGLDQDGPEVALTATGGGVTYLSGDALTFTTIRDLNRYDPGWRGVTAGTPCRWYLDPDGGLQYVGLYPAPDLGGTSSWASGTLTVPYKAVPADLTLDADVPFTVSANALTTLAPYHQALVHYAAAQLEKLRREWDAVKLQEARFGAYVDQFKGAITVPGGKRVRFARDYRRERALGRDEAVTVKGGSGWIDWPLR